jgi:hypothetical protein
MRDFFIIFLAFLAAQYVAPFLPRPGIGKG